MQKRGWILIILLALILLTAYAYGPAIKNEITGLVTSQLGNLSATITTMVSCTWSDQALNVSFGDSLNPGTDNYNGSRNWAEADGWSSYNITVDTLSNKQANITIKGDHMVSGLNKIYIDNVTWMSNTTNGTGPNMLPPGSKILLTDYDKNASNYIAVAEPIGSSVWYRFWLDVPASQVAGNYLGNYTMQCEAAT